jgi:two-component system chemotaxis response regulator CheY
MNRDMKILVVDDLEAMRLWMCDILSHLGFTNVIAAQDGQQALEIIREDRVDFIITDLDMPAMDGIELLRAIRSDDALKHLPVLFITGEAEESSVIKVAQAGVNDYLLKPFSLDVLDRKIQKIFEQ